MESEPTLTWGSSRSLFRAGDLNPLGEPEGLSAAFGRPGRGIASTPVKIRGNQSFGSSGSALRANLMLRPAQVVAAFDAAPASAADYSARGERAKC